MFTILLVLSFKCIVLGCINMMVHWTSQTLLCLVILSVNNFFEKVFT